MNYIKTYFNNFINFFLNESIKNDSEAERQAKNIILFTAVLIAWSPVFSITYFFMNSIFLSTSVSTAALIGLIVFSILKYTKYINLAGNLLVLNMVGIIGVTIYFMEGRNSPVFPWLLLIPILSILCVKIWYWNLLWIGITTLESFIIYFLSFSGHSFPKVFDNQHLQIIEIICFISLLGIIISVISIHEYHRIFLMNLVAHKEKDLLQEIKKHKLAQEKLRQAQNQLIEVSHAAGMSEVASGVLHNVGNILNSINISVETIKDKLKMSSIERFHNIATLIKSNLENIEHFISSDKKGKIIPQYLIQFSETIKTEFEVLSKETKYLSKNINNIKNIISLQQSLAGKSGIIEEFELNEVISQAIQINEEALLRHKADLTKEIDSNIQCQANRLKLLQIIINLISNAKYATSSNKENTQGNITIKAKKQNDNLVKIEIIDNGIGIDKKNINNIFQYGFTTKKDGHGFGLHHSALAAKELGGKLTAKSDGIGKGSNFILKIPLKPTK